MIVSAAPGNPNANAQVYQNGEIVASVEESYVRVSGGWRLNTMYNTTYSGGSPSYTGGGEVEEDPVWEMTKEGSFSRPLIQLADRCVKAVGAFVTPAEAFAAPVDPCRQYMKDVAWGVGGMIASALTENPIGFILSGLHVANSMHAFARCREAAT